MHGAAAGGEKDDDVAPDALPVPAEVVLVLAPGAEVLEKPASIGTGAGGGQAARTRRRRAVGRMAILESGEDTI